MPNSIFLNCISFIFMIFNFKNVNPYLNNLFHMIMHNFPLKVNKNKLMLVVLRTISTILVYVL